MIGKRLAEKLYRDNVIRQDEIEKYEYGMNILVSSIVDVIILLGISIVLRNVLGAIIFIAVFIFLREHSGGFHASTRLRCKVCTVTCECAVLLADRIEYGVTGMLLVCGAIWVFTMIMLIKYAPVENKNRVINNPRKHKKISIVTANILMCIQAVGIITGVNNRCIMYTVFAVSLLIMVTKLHFVPYLCSLCHK